MIKFIPDSHQYISLDGSDRKWLSVTSLVGMFIPPFDKLAKAQSCSNRKPGRWPNKWYNISVDEILKAWDSEGKRSVELGHWYHDKREQQLLTEPNVHMSVSEEGIKIAPEQVLTEGIYPEHLMYMASAALCGQSDKVEVRSNKFHIRDYKTSKEIKRVGFKNWEGVVSKMLVPLQHLDECEYNHYALQLSTYAFMIQRHNPSLQVGDLIIEHIKFKVQGHDKYGYPVYMKDHKGEYIVEDIELIQLPYMKSEVLAMLNHIKTTKAK